MATRNSAQVIELWILCVVHILFVEPFKELTLEPFVKIDRKTVRNRILIYEIEFSIQITFKQINTHSWFINVYGRWSVNKELDWRSIWKLSDSLAICLHYWFNGNEK